jgi:hypothetical protein
VLRLMPRMALEAPHEYVAFVERHLPRLRRDAALVVGEGHDADELYPDELTDVAARWGLFELLRTRLGRADAADAYLRRAFARRAKRWQDEQITPVEVQVWQVEQLPGPVETGGWHPEQLAPVHARTGQSAPARPMWTSMALRLAPVLLASSRMEIRPLAEAAVAWWHAYEAQRRRKYIAVGAVFMLVLALLTRVPLRDSEIFSAPPAGPAVVSDIPGGAPAAT